MKEDIRREFKIVMEDPKMEIVNSGILFVADVIVFERGEEILHRHTSYESVEDAVRKAKRYINTVLEGKANLDAWLAAEGRIL